MYALVRVNLPRLCGVYIPELMGIVSASWKDIAMDAVRAVGSGSFALEGFGGLCRPLCHLKSSCIKIGSSVVLYMMPIANGFEAHATHIKHAVIVKWPAGFR